MKNQENKLNSFKELGINPALLERLNEMGFVKPTPIQFKSIPIAIKGEDIVGIAQTGSGKTLAFSIPMIEGVVKTQSKGLVLLPTRELAVQVQENLEAIAGKHGLKTSLIIGGTGIKSQIKSLKNDPHIIVATPGRLLDHANQKNIDLSQIGILVLDEADRMLDMGFAPQLNKIVSSIPKKRQTLLFSATMPEEIASMAHKYMKEPLRIEVASPGTTAKNIDQEMFIVPKSEKMDLLKRILTENDGSVLIFSRTKRGAKTIASKIRKFGYGADEIHSNRSQNQRQRALKGFTEGKYRVLVATDIAARGIDVDHIKLVVNYDLPTQIEDYTHRIGRTGRAGRSGKAISFAIPEQKGDIAQIQNLINLTLPIKAPCGKKIAKIAPSANAKRHNPQKKRVNKANRSKSNRRRRTRR